jgi:hypothetical protein
MLYLRLLPYAEKAISCYQCGFRQGESTIDQIYTLRQILEKTAECNVRPTTYLLILVQHMTLFIEHGYMLKCKSSNSLIN